MIRRFNYTGRQKVPHKSVRLAISGAPNLELNDVSWDLTAHSFPGDSAVYLEATSSGTPAVVRMQCGTVDRPRLPEHGQRSLSLLPGDVISFDLKVVDESGASGRILGFAHDLRPATPGKSDEGENRGSLLPVNPTDLGDEVWRLDLVNSPRPYLEVNKQIPGIMERIRGDSTFLSLVYPAVIRRILVQVLLIEEIDEVDQSAGWQGEWLAWGQQMHPDHEAPPRGEGANLKDDQSRWIEEVACGFAASQRLSTIFENQGIEAGDQV